MNITKREPKSVKLDGKKKYVVVVPVDKWLKTYFFIKKTIT